MIQLLLDYILYTYTLVLCDDFTGSSWSAKDALVVPAASRFISAAWRMGNCWGFCCGDLPIGLKEPLNFFRNHHLCKVIFGYSHIYGRFLKWPAFSTTNGCAELII